MNWRIASPFTLAFLTLFLATCYAQDDAGKDIFGQRVNDNKPNPFDANSPFDIKPRNNRPQGLSFLPETIKKTIEEQQLYALNRGVLAEPQGADHAKIFAALDRKIDVNFDEAQLVDLADAIRTAGGVNVKLDTPALEGVGIAEDTPFDANLKNLPLRDAMTSILREMELAYQVRNGILYITTPEEAEYASEARVYRVEDLVKPSQRLVIQRPSTINKAAAELIDAIKLTIAPESWDDVGGPGSITTLSFGNRCLLTISQTTSIQYEIAEFLAAMRVANKAENPLAGESEDNPAKRKAVNDDVENTHIYPLHPKQKDAGAELLRVVQLAIQEDGKAEYAAGSIAVRGPNSVHERVARLLTAYNKLAIDCANRGPATHFPPASGFGIGAGSGLMKAPNN